MIKSRLQGHLLILLLILWGIITLLAMAAMYKLWWDRERVNYLGKTVVEQRVTIWKISGLPLKLLHSLEEVEQNWPRETSYSVTGDHNQVSYLKYLLLPRIPSGSTHYSLDDTTKLSISSVDPSVTHFEEQHRLPILSIVGSFLTLGGVALALKKYLEALPLSFPEIFCCASLLLVCSVVLSRVLFSTAIPGFYLLTIIGSFCWLGLFITCFRTKNRKNVLLAQNHYHNNITCQEKLVLGWNTVFYSIIALLVIWAILMSVVVVVDDWDAWAIWGAKAKVLALGTGPLFDVSYFGHGDYPLLWPSIWAFSGWWGGGWEEMWSRGWGSIFLLLTIWELTVIVTRITGRRTLGLLCGALFVSVPMVPLVASWSYAEAPFWLMTTSCFGCLLLSKRKEEQMVPIVIVAGLLAAAAAHTKNEGVMFVLLAVLWVFLTPGRRKITSVACFLTMFIVFYAPWLVWTKSVLQFGSHATAGLHFDMENIHRAMDRLPSALEAIWKIWSDIKQWNIVLWCTLVASVVTLGKRNWLKYYFIPFGILLGYFVIIVFHEAEIYWQVGTSWNRLTVHALPLLLIGSVVHLKSWLSTIGKV